MCKLENLTRTNFFSSYKLVVRCDVNDWTSTRRNVNEVTSIKAHWQPGTKGQRFWASKHWYYGLEAMSCPKLALRPLNDFFTSLLTTRSPTAGLLATHVCADWLLDWSLAVKWARLQITNFIARYPKHWRLKYSLRNCEKWTSLKTIGLDRVVGVVSRG